MLRSLRSLVEAGLQPRPQSLTSPGSIGALGVALCGVLIGAQEPPATLIIWNGPIYTADTAHPTAEAVAVRDGRIVRVGSDAEVMRLKGPQTEVLDLQGATLVPGLQDAHGHVLGLGASLTTLDLRDTPTSTRIAELVAERAKTVPAGQWILGSGWDQNDWPEQAWPTREILDRAAPNHPVLLKRIDGHASWANSRAMQAAGIDATTPDPSGGRLIRDAANTPTGILVDTAQQLVQRHVTESSAAELEARVLAADRTMSGVGLTMVHDAGASTGTIELYRRLAAEGRLNTRLYVMIDSSQATTREWFKRGPLIDRDHRVTVRAVKLYADGALGSRGAALLEPYDDEPSNRGLLVTPPERLATIAREAARAGFQPATHAIGDAANRRVLDIYETIEREVPGARALRPRIEHAQILDALDIPRFASLGVIASMQPTHCTSDMPWAPARIGAARVAEGAYVWQKLLHSGAKLAAGSDFPVEHPDPLLGFYAAVTRQTVRGEPAGGWTPAERLSRDEALRAFTADAAYAAHAEQDLGTIEAGKLADFVVLSRDIMKTNPPDILRTAVVRTIVAGRTVYSAPSPSSSK
jgi:predicted amidohydrolase YtcJ